MEMETTTFSPTSVYFGGILLVTISILWSLKRGFYNMPGPKGLPFFGNFFQVTGKSSMDVLQEWRLKYGNIYSISFMGTPKVVVSGEEGLREVLITKSNDFAGRPLIFRREQFLRGHSDIGGTDFDHNWTVRKKAFINSLKMYGDGLSSLENITQEILANLTETLADKQEEEIDVKDVLHKATSDIMSSIIFGRLLDREGLKELADIDDATPEVLSPLGNGVELDLFPWLRFFGGKNYKRLMAVVRQSYNWFSKEIAFNKKEHYIPGDPKCVLDAILMFQQKEMDDKGNPIISDDDVHNLMHQMIIAGTSTTSFTMYHFIAIFADRQDIQRRIQKEIDAAIASRIPSLADRMNAPYTEATILEGLRFTTIAPILIPHKTTKSTTLCGYTLPAGVEVWANVWNLHHSEEYWDEPYTFKPERFLDDNGELVPSDHINRKRLLPFGAGRRVCPGEALGKNRLFLFVTTLLQKFNFTPSDGARMPADPRKYKFGFLAIPHNYKVKVSIRT